MCWLLVKNHSEYVTNLEKEAMRPTAAIYKNVQGSILNGTFNVMFCQSWGGCCSVKTTDGKEHIINNKWDLIIAHPPCTYLTNCATRAHSLRMTPINKINDRTLLRIEAMEFFMKFVYADCGMVAIENPVGVMNTCYRKPDQTIHPYMFASSTKDKENYFTKATCLWLKGLPQLKTNDLPKPNNAELFGLRPNGRAFTWEEKLCRAGGASKARSKTFPGIAEAMAEQWGCLEKPYEETTQISFEMKEAEA